MYERNEYGQPIGFKVENEVDPKLAEETSLEGKFCTLNLLQNRIF